CSSPACSSLNRCDVAIASGREESGSANPVRPAPSLPELLLPQQYPVPSNAAIAQVWSSPALTVRHFCTTCSGARCSNTSNGAAPTVATSSPPPRLLAVTTPLGSTVNAASLLELQCTWAGLS